MRVRVLIAFNGMRPGDEGVPADPERAKGYVRLGLMEILDGGDSGEREAGPGGSETGDPGSVPAGTGESRETGSEPGEGFGTGGYGSAQG